MYHSLSIVWRDKADSENYEQARVKRVFNHEIPQKYPLAIVFVKKESDIVDAVKLAVEKKCGVSVRSGGHSWPVWSVQDDVILVDLGDYSEIVLDENTGIVRVSPSTTGINLHNYLFTKGRVFTAGHCPDVGVGGALLCGGMGWNCNNWGFACEHIVAVDVVTANGKLVRADTLQNTDLFWASRGAGPCFPGVVTRFHLQTKPAPKSMHSSGYIYPMSSYRTAYNWILKVASGFDNGIEAVAIGSYPQGIDAPCITIALIALGDNDEAMKAVLQHIEESHPTGTVAHWFYEKTSLRQEFETKAKAYPINHRYCVDSSFLKDDADVVGVLEKAFTTLPTKKSLVLWNTMIPRSRRDLPDMALSLQSDHYFAIYGVCEPESEYSRCESWVHDIMAEVGKHEVSAYLGEFDLRARRSKVWGDKESKKLMDVRREWDPEGRVCTYLGLEYTELRIGHPQI